MQTQLPAQQATQHPARNEQQHPQPAHPHTHTHTLLDDARPAATAQLRMQSLMANSAQTTQLKSLQATMAASTQAKHAHSPIAPGANSTARNTPVQRMDDEEIVQQKPDEAVQTKAAELIQKKPDDFAQKKSEDSVQKKSDDSASAKPNNTGLPDNLKSGIENLSGINMDHVRVHYNSDKPAQLQAHAYAQGSDIHVAPGQEKHLPHEAWHVVQQAQGRVKPTVQMKGDDLAQHQLLNRQSGTNNLIQFELITYEEFNKTKTGQGKLGDAYTAHISNTDATTGVDPKKTGKDCGLGAPVENGNVQTEISWNAAQDDDGMEMTAFLGPDHKRGSSPGKDGVWAKKREGFSKLAKKYPYIAGHLLNEELGGPGNDARNLVAIPTDINSAHSAEIEQHVKKQVNDEGRWGKYEVKITHSPLTPPYTSSPPTAPAKTYTQYASKLTAHWTPQGWDHNTGTWVDSEGEKKELVLTIKSPYDYGTGARRDGAEGSANLINASTAENATTTFNYDQIVLTSKTSAIVAAGISNVNFIKTLEKNQNIVNQAIADFKDRVKKLEAELEKKDKDFEEQTSKLEIDAEAKIAELKGNFETEKEQLIKKFQTDFATQAQELTETKQKLTETEQQLGYANAESTKQQAQFAALEAAYMRALETIACTSFQSLRTATYTPPDMDVDSDEESSNGSEGLANTNGPSLADFLPHIPSTAASSNADQASSSSESSTHQGQQMPGQEKLSAHTCKRARTNNFHQNRNGLPLSRSNTAPSGQTLNPQASPSTSPSSRKRPYPGSQVADSPPTKEPRLG